MSKAEHIKQKLENELTELTNVVEELVQLLPNIELQNVKIQDSQLLQERRKTKQTIQQLFNKLKKLILKDSNLKSRKRQELQRQRMKKAQLVMFLKKGILGDQLQKWKKFIEQYEKLETHPNQLIVRKSWFFIMNKRYFCKYCQKKFVDKSIAKTHMFLQCELKSKLGINKADKLIEKEKLIGKYQIISDINDSIKLNNHIENLQSENDLIDLISQMDNQEDIKQEQITINQVKEENEYNCKQQNEILKLYQRWISFINKDEILNKATLQLKKAKQKIERWKQNLYKLLNKGFEGQVDQKIKQKKKQFLKYVTTNIHPGLIMKRDYWKFEVEDRWQCRGCKKTFTTKFSCQRHQQRLCYKNKKQLDPFESKKIINKEYKKIV